MGGKARRLTPEEARTLRRDAGAMPSTDLTRRLHDFLDRTDGRVYRMSDGTVLWDSGMGATLHPSEESFLALIDRDPTENFTRPWATRTGIEIDQNVGVFLIEAPPAKVTEALRPLAIGAMTNVLGQEIPVAEVHTFVFRWEGHPWSTVLRHALVPRIDEQARQAILDLSRREACAVIAYDASDTMGSIGYTLFESGAERELFSSLGEGESEFRSTVRSTTVDEIEEPHDFVSELFAERRAYVSAISPEYFFGHRRPTSKTARVQNPGFTLVAEREISTVPTFETIDYLWFPGRLPSFLG
jgi:hypothetical protein